MPVTIRDKDVLDYHSKPVPGKIEVHPTKPCLTQRDLSIAYSPGVAIPCLKIAENPDDVYRYTSKGNLVAVVSNGTAVLGLGAIGAAAGKPVMEGKGVLFKRFAGIDVFDIELDTTDPAELIRAVQLMEPTFGGINLEDIKAPECFEIEATLKRTMNIPVFHDDQHGTAIISGAGLLNALRVNGKRIEDIKIVVCGAGAAGIACARFYLTLGAGRENLLMTDSRGVIYKGREAGMNPHKEEFARETDLRTLEEAMLGADMFTGCSIKGMVTPEMLLGMADDPIVFAMANPDPEIPYDVAVQTRSDVIMATGRSDFPNQANNVLGFPFLFRGALDVRARNIDESMKVAAAHALAELAREPVPDLVKKAYGGVQIQFGREYIIPKPFDPRVLTCVCPAVARAAMESGSARKPIEDFDAYVSWLESTILGLNQAMNLVYSRAKEDPHKVVFPEGSEPRVLQAAQTLRDARIAEPILIGEPDRIRARIESLGLDLPDVTIVDPCTDGRREEYVQAFYRLRRRKGVRPVTAELTLRDHLYYGLMMVREEGAADGLVCGINRGYAQTIRPTLQVIDLAPGFELVSGIYMMGMRDKVLFFADATVNIEPTAEQLAEITVNAARTVSAMFDITPRVAMLSFSNFGSTPHALSRKVQRATQLVQQREPDLVIDGEMMADSALVAETAGYFPHCSIQGDANVLIFPDLQSGNIAYKLVQHLAKADVVGPILVGLSKPVNVLNHDSTVGEIVNMAAITTAAVEH